MERINRSRLAVGLILLLLGAWFLAVQFFPSLAQWINIEFAWPLIIVLVGAGLFIFGLLIGVPEMSVPAVIVAGIGGILYYQNATNDWESWAYIWSLIPGFVGIGVLLSALLGGKERDGVSGGLWLILISAILFLIFGSVFGGLGILGNWWPVLLILLGLWLLVRAFLRRRT